MRLTPLFVLLASLLSLIGCGGDGETPDGTTPVAAPDGDSSSAPPVAEVTLPLPKYPTGMCRVYSAVPGLMVFVDGEPARDAEGNFLRTPCEVQVRQGSRTITAAAPDFQDAPRVVTVSKVTEVEFPELVAADERSMVSATAPLLNVRVGEPVPLEAVNSPGAELDPLLSADGLTLWFAGDRGGARGVSVATRTSLLHEFGEPELLLLTRGPNVPGSPSVSEDTLTVYYGTPSEGRIWSISRGDPLGRFDDKETILFNPTGEVEWPACQVLPDGLRAYWIERRGDELKGFAAVRTSITEKFSPPIPYPLPGLIPALSTDGLRQYEFDGKVLRRWRRASLSESFTASEELQTLNLPNYRSAGDRRQFFITPDEQWMIYCADPVATPDLFFVRLTKAPRWGVPPIGKSIPPKPKMSVAATTPNSPNESAMEKPPVVQELAPHPYSVYAREWTALVRERKYAEAEQLTRKAQADTALRGSRDELQSDLELLQELQQFRASALGVFQTLKPGTVFSIGTIRVELIKLEGETLHFKLGMQVKEQAFFELPPLTLAQVVEANSDKQDPNILARVALFQLFDRDPNISAIMTKLAGTPEAQHRVVAQATRRPLHEAQLEFDRGQLSTGFDLLQPVRENFPETPAAVRANELVQSLYSRIEWSPVGSRKWTSDRTEGAFTAAEGRAENSYLRSPRPLRNYDLQFEWKTTGRVGQGGVYFHYSGEGNVFNRAFKIHLGNDLGTATDQYCTGSLFGREAPTTNAVRPQTEWNESRLVVRGSKVVFWLNGAKVLDTLAIDDQLPEEGFVLFDGITGGITYRHILLMEAAGNSTRVE